MLRIASMAALAASLDAAALAFPLAGEVDNNAWSVAVEPETGTMVAPYSQTKVVIRSASKLTRLMGNIETLNILNKWPEGAGLALLLEDPAEAAALAAAEADAAANQAKAQALADAQANAALAAAEADAPALAPLPTPVAPPAVQHHAQANTGKRGR